MDTVTALGNTEHRGRLSQTHGFCTLSLPASFPLVPVVMTPTQTWLQYKQKLQLQPAPLAQLSSVLDQRTTRHEAAAPYSADVPGSCSGMGPVSSLNFNLIKQSGRLGTFKFSTFQATASSCLAKV